MKRPAEEHQHENGSDHKHHKHDEKLLPVSLLCGFLGAGKTTLLKHILETKHSEKTKFNCAVIVNDVAELNVDAALIDDSALVQSEGMIAMQNGCVCCTLKTDLLNQIIELAKKKTFDYMIIEASGVSEPSQIGKLFAQCSEQHDHGAHTGETLGELARLDTCVTVVDSADFFRNLGNIVQGPKPESFPQLLVEQVEYSNVVVLNKADLVEKAQLEKIHEQVTILAPNAKVLTCKNSKINVMDVVNTGLYRAADFEKFHEQIPDIAEEAIKPCCAAKTAKGESPCCLRKRTVDSGKSKVFLAPGKSGNSRHANRFGITSFIYKARRPFNAARFDSDFVSKFFVVHSAEQWSNEEWSGEWEEDQQAKKDSGAETVVEEKDANEEKTKASEPETKSTASAKDTDEATKADQADAAWDWKKEASEKEALRTEVMGSMFRSKGFIWLANNHDFKGVFNHAGNLVKITEVGGLWSVMEAKAWEGTEKEMADLRKDWVEPWGDRRQDLVFIGKDLNHKAIQEILDGCLLTDKEFSLGIDFWKATMGDKVVMAVAAGVN